MWCHLCTQDYPDFEDFRIHIMEKHRNASNLNEENSDSESAHENTENSEVDDENAAFNMSEENCYESDHSLGAEIKSDASMDGNDNTDALNTLPGKYRNMITEFKSDDSMDEDNTVPEEYNMNNAALNNLLVKYRDTDIKIKSDDSIDAEDNTVPENCSNLDHTIATKNKSNLSKASLNNLPGKSHGDEAGPSVIKKTTLKKPRQRCKKENKARALNKSPKKSETLSILKKRGRKKTLKVSFSKKALPKHRMSSFSQPEDIPGDSNGHSDSSLNDDNKVNSQSIPSNFVNPASVIPVNNYPQPISNNNPVYIVNPYGGQGMNNFVLGNQAVQPPLYVVNTPAAKPTTSTAVKAFEFNSENIVKWLTKHKELCKNIAYPLPPSLFDRLKTVHKGIFDHYCTASMSEETAAVLKVYEELDCMIHKHINSINNALSIL